MLVVGGGALVAAALFWPLERFGDGGQQAIGPIAARDAGPPALSSFVPAWAVNLRKPLNDNEVVTSVVGSATRPADAGVGVRLVGTIVDAQRPRGIFVTPLGQMELRGVGDKTAGAVVLRVDERSATIFVAGREVTLRVEKLESSSFPTDSTTAPPPSARSGP
jgi:hypothetical protein